MPTGKVYRVTGAKEGPYYIIDDGQPVVRYLECDPLNPQPLGDYVPHDFQGFMRWLKGKPANRSIECVSQDPPET